MRIHPSDFYQRGRIFGILALLVAMFAALLGPVSAASAAVATQPSKTVASKAVAGKTAASKTTADKTTGSSASGTAAGASAAVKPAAKPVPPTQAKTPAAVPAAEVRQDRAVAAKSAKAAATVPNTCSGAISADTVYPCSTPSSTGTDTFTLTLTSAHDLLVIQAPSAGGYALQVTVTAPDGTVLNCEPPAYYQLPQCATSAAGTYTLQVANGGQDYTLSFMPLLSDTTCSVANPSFTTPTLQGTVAAGAVGTCYTLKTASGNTVLADSTSTGDSFLVTVYDSTGAQICFDDQGTCTLTGTGPYRVLVDDYMGSAYAYYLQLNDITQPTGCKTVAQQVYGTVPADSSTDLCRAITVTTAGEYQLYAVSSTYSGISDTLYNPDGSVACSNSGSDCQLAAGSYNLVLNEYPSYTDKFGIVFIAAAETSGCTATGDTDFASGAATGRFAGLGEEFCLNLPTASGLSDYIFDQEIANGSEAPAQIVDATGAQQCPYANLSFATCALSGTAPFRIILADQQTTDTGYRILAQQTGSSAGCAVWPQSGFGGSFGAKVTLTATSDVKCLSIPAAQHSTGEMIDYSNTTNQVDGAIYVNDPSGNQVCLGASTAICAYTPGVAYTALVETTGNGDTYDLVRRDVSQTATCSTPASTAIGGPSTEISLTSDLDTVCERVTAATTDDLWFSIRSLAPGSAGAILEVTDSAGAIVCRQYGAACQLSGNTDYQLIVTALGYDGISITAHLDTWLVATAAGWASQCAANSLSESGWAPLSGTLTEAAPAYCAVVAIQPNKFFDIYGTDTASAPNTALVSMFTAADWTSGNGLCYGTNYGEFGFSCQTSNSTAGEALMIVSLGGAQSPTSYTIQGVPSPQPQATVTAVSPPSQPAGGDNEITLTGANLSLGTQVELATDGVQAYDYFAGAVAVNAAGTQLSVELNTSALTPGVYDIVLNGAGYSTGTPSPGYLPGAYTVTAALPTPANSAFVPVKPAQILNTQTSTSAKAAVAADGTATLKVEGVGAVPATGVTAVALDVTAVDPAAAGSLTVYPDGAALPTVTDAGFAAGQTVTDLVVVPVTDGKVDLYNASTGQTNLVVDVDGYYTTASGVGSELTTIGPDRILNTQTGVGATEAPVAADGTVDLAVDGVGAVPATGVTAVLLDVTAISPAAAGSIAAYADGTTRPNVTDASFAAGQTVTDLVVVPVTDGNVDLYNASTGQTNLTADVEGYYSATGSGFQPLGPARILDTRTGLGGSGETVLPHAAAVTRVMDVPGIPGTVTAVVLSVTVVCAQDAGTLTVLPDGQALPGESNLAFAADQVVTDQVVVPIVNGEIDLYNGSIGNIQVTADIEGYYTS
jgi:hypothetical protein